ncbi:MAG: SUF system NifU family Fe-S cluster assembly protein [Verrucomicrobiota bacterium]|nr:SUF system NifU family Fe-S cluster assembly protein [Verrucomicrobiota bacterium]
MQELYQEIILDHNKRPRNYRLISNPTHMAEGHNPLCGDEMSLQFIMEGDIIKDIAFQGEGCAISKASASLLTATLKGKTIAAAKAEVGTVLELLTSENEPTTDQDSIGDLAALSGVRKFPARIKCATLAWHTFTAAIEGKQETSSE